jgi:FAD/FMN-containing dehydrogenase
MRADNVPSSALETRLRCEMRGEGLFDVSAGGRYATDASIYQIEPLGVILPESREEAAAPIPITRNEGVSVLRRGGGTSQGGQTVAPALIIDCSNISTRL